MHGLFTFTLHISLGLTFSMYTCNLHPSFSLSRTGWSHAFGIILYRVRGWETAECFGTKIATQIELVEPLNPWTRVLSTPYSPTIASSQWRTVRLELFLDNSLHVKEGLSPALWTSSLLAMTRLTVKPSGSIHWHFPYDSRTMVETTSNVRRQSLWMTSYTGTQYRMRHTENRICF